MSDLFAGAISGCAARLAIAPLDVIKIRTQLSQDAPVSMVQTFRQILRQEGVTAFWKGNASALWLYASYSAIQFEVYSRLKYTNWFLAGAISGMVATSLTFPFDTLRTRFAAQTATRTEIMSSGEFVGYRSIWHAMSMIYRTEGLKAFYRGLGASLTQIAPYMGIVFGTHEYISGLLTLPEEYNNLVSGSIAGVVGKTAVMPLDTVRKRMQVQSKRFLTVVNAPSYQRVSMVHIFGQIVQHEGFLALFKGLAPALLKAGPSSAVTFAVHGWVMKYLQVHNP